MDFLGFLIITLNCNVTIVGKLWLVFTILLRMLAIVLAGFPIYQDEQERFVCNTLQPGCANICYDLFAPVSPLRFWLVQSAAVLLPYAVFSAYVVHRAAPLALSAGGRARVPDFSAAYALQLGLRALLEAVFAAGHYLLFGLSVPRTFACARAPCSSAVDCYVSRPTEKSVLMLFLWAASALSFLLSVADLACSLRGRASGRRGSLTSPPGWPEGREASRCVGQADQDGGWQEEGAPALPGLGTRGRGASSPCGASGQVELPGEVESEVMSLASDKLATAHKKPGDRPYREATQDSGNKSPARAGEPPSASQSHLAARCSSRHLAPPGPPAAAGSAPHLRTQKSQWV